MHHIQPASLCPSAMLRVFAFAVLVLIAPASWCAVDAKAAKYYEDALVRYEKEDLTGTIIQLKNALQIDKNMLPVHMLLGKALLKNGEVVAAEVALTEALRLGVNRAEIVVPLAQAYLAQGKQPLVLSQPQFSIAGLPPDIALQVWLLQSTASADMGDLRSALYAIDEAKKLDARSVAPWLAEVPIRIRSKQFKEANAAVEQAMDIMPNSAETWYQKGSIAHASGHLPATLLAYDQALKLDPKHTEARVGRAGVYIDSNRLSEAQADVDELRRVSPREPRAAYMQALLAERNKKPEVARQALKEVVTLIDPVPMNFIRYKPQLLMLNGLSHHGLNEPEKAKQYLEAFDKAQGNTPVVKLLAQIYVTESNTDRALALLEPYLKANPNDSQAMTLLSSALMTKGQHARATSLMQQALAIQDTPELRTVLGFSLLRSGQAETGIAQLEAAFQKDPRQTQAATALVGLYLRSRQAAKAVGVAQTLVKQQPANAGFFNMLGMARGQSGDASGARAAFEKAVALDAVLVPPKLNLARLDIANRSYDAAAKRLAAVLQSDTKNTEAMFEMAVLSERRGQMADAQRWLEKATDLSGPKETRWGLALSDFHLRHGRPGPALAAVKGVASKEPNALAVLMAYARAELANNDRVGAQSSLTAATRVADYNPVVQVDIALLQLAAKDRDGAAYSLNKALSAQPDFLPAMALMTEVELRQGEPVKAEKRAHDIVAKFPKRAVGFSLLGDIAQSKGQRAQALVAYQRAHQTEPGTDSFLRLFGALSAQDDGKPALQLAEQWAKAHPKDATGQKMLANAYARNGQFAAAKTAYENLLKATPDDSDALNNLANVLLRLKDPGAIAVAEQAVAKNPGDFNALDTLGWALFQAGQNDRALQLLRDARLREPANPEIRYHLASVLAKMGRRREARDELEAALKGRPTFEDVSQAEALLKTLK